MAVPYPEAVSCGVKNKIVLTVCKQRSQHLPYGSQTRALRVRVCAKDWGQLGEPGAAVTEVWEILLHAEAARGRGFTQSRCSSLPSPPNSQSIWLPNPRCSRPWHLCPHGPAPSSVPPRLTLCSRVGAAAIPSSWGEAASHSVCRIASERFPAALPGPLNSLVPRQELGINPARDPRPPQHKRLK